jgi:hypothetical protein
MIAIVIITPQKWGKKKKKTLDQLHHLNIKQIINNRLIFHVFNFSLFSNIHRGSWV